MRKLTLHGWETCCDRCGNTLSDVHITLCGECSEVLPEQIRPRDLRFADCSEKLCARCGQELGEGNILDLCTGCASRHSDTTHADFGRSEVAVFSRCGRCGSLQVSRSLSGEGSDFLYYRVGSRVPTEEAFECPARGAAKIEVEPPACAHQWLRVLVEPPADDEPLAHDAALLFVTDEQVEMLRDETKHGSLVLWCCLCGALSHLTRDPAAGMRFVR